MSVQRNYDENKLSIQSNESNTLIKHLYTMNRKIEFISITITMIDEWMQTPPQPELSSLFVQRRRMMQRANRTVQSTELFIGTCKLLSILADVTMKVTSNLLTNSNLWSIQTLLVLTTANTFYYKTDFRTAAATFYCCEPSSTCPDQQSLTQGSRLNQQGFSLSSGLYLSSSCRSAFSKISR